MLAVRPVSNKFGTSQPVSLTFSENPSLVIHLVLTVFLSFPLRFMNPLARLVPDAKPAPIWLSPADSNLYPEKIYRG